jgi:nucleoside-diphosphate-sugar epimerase
LRVAVTGANGFVGAHVVRELLKRGDDVVAVVRKSSRRHRLADLVGLEVVETDILDETGRQRVAPLRVDACVHTAWYTEAGKYLSSPANVDLIGATLHLATTLAQAGCRRFVGVGTCFEYDTERGWLSEDTPLAPAHLYSAAKAGTYLALRELSSLTGIQVAWARLFYLYGPDEYPSRLVPAVSVALLRGEEARSTPGMQVRDFLHVEDVASALAAITHSDVTDAINVGSGQPVTVAAIVERIAAICGRPDLVRLGAIPYGSRDPMFVCADVRKLVRATGWTQRWSLHDGLSSTVDWWRNHVASSHPR